MQGLGLGVGTLSLDGSGCQNRFGIPFWGSTTHFRTYFSGDWEIHWGCGILTHGQMRVEPIFGPK